LREALERLSGAEVENATALASAHKDAKGFARKVTLLVGELVAECRDWEVSEREC
jgi:hypothetical protein